MSLLLKYQASKKGKLSLVPSKPASPSTDQAYHTLERLALAAVAPETAYTRDELVKAILATLEAPPIHAYRKQKALELIQQLLHRGLLEATPTGHRLYLGGSTPF